MEKELFEWVKASKELPDDQYSVFIWVNRVNPNIGYYDKEENLWYWYEYGEKVAQPNLPDNTVIEWLKPIPQSEISVLIKSVEQLTQSLTFFRNENARLKESSLTPKSIRDSAENKTKK